MKRILILVLVVAFGSSSIFAGNPDRIGESGAHELLINGWPRTTGLWDNYTARVTGVESMRLNPAGLAHIQKMEIVLAQTLWFQGSDTQVSQAGFAGKVGSDNVFGFSLMSLNVGDLYRTTVNNPDPNNGLGTFKPSFINLGVSFARTFSNRIYGGATVRLISQSVENVNAFGFALDAGLQYVLGPKENLRFGVSIRNLGTPMRFRGDGFTFRGDEPDNGDYELTLSQNSNKFELPAQLTLGTSYDFWMGPEYRCNGGYNLHRLTLSGQFTSNTFGKDNFGGGLEYAFKEMFMVRGGYRHEQGILNPDNRTSAYTGFSGGFSVAVPFKDNGPALGIDYSYRSSNPFGGTHSIGIRFGLGDGTECGDETDVVEGKDAFSDEKVTVAKPEPEPTPKPEKVKKVKEIKLSKTEVATIERISSAIEFETGSTDLTAEAKAELDELVVFMNDKTAAKVDIMAYTDNVGSDEDNLQLSRERAFAVKTYLMDAGIDAERLKGKGFGEENPIADNETAEGRARNRRVELKVY